uniref:Protocadherin 2 alpha a 15 n=1 Tax=Oreochromis niloticus TaxID=8128 RepID=A0A669E649_ORENI
MCVIDLKTVLENPLEVHYVAVEILDVNDHAPIFPEKENTLEISESALPGARFQLQAARDADSGSLSVQQYKLSHNEHFRLEVKDRGEDRKTPSLVLQKSLDRESVKTHVLLLTAFDGGKPPRSGNMTIIVNVSDVNDNPPVFSKEAYSAHLKENSPFGTTVIQVNATDLDEGLNATMTTDKIIIINIIDVNDNAPEIEVTSFSHYNVLIVAKDAGEPSLSSEKSINIVISDVNDNSPEFLQNPYTFYITENNRPGASIFSVAALKDRGKDQKIPFLVLQKQLDRETNEKHKLRLTAVDGGKPAKSGDIEITVDVLDINDNSPVFTKELYSATLKENIPTGTVVIQVNATDLDQGANGEIIYSFGNEVDPKIMELFSIDANTGEIHVTGKLDFEKSTSYEIDIQASDKAHVPLKTGKSVVITVADVNDNPPEIEVTSFSSSIKEDSKIGTTVALISVTDLDSGINGKVICAIKQGVPFTLSPSLQENMYAIVTISQLDREITSQYDVTIIAKDSGEPPHLTEKTISVVISDVNDNSPEFSTSPYTFYITENNSPGASLKAARDQDSGQFSVQQYKLSNNDHFRLEIKDKGDDGKIPILVVQKSLDRETAGSHVLSLTALDGGKPPKSSEMNILVNVLDINDNAPAFSKDDYSVTLNENTPLGTIVVQVNAIDLDDGPNGDVVYSFGKSINQKDLNLFAISPLTGELSVKGLINYEEREKYEIEIQASDKGMAPLTTEKSVKIKIVDLNDNAPEIEVTSFSSSIPEDSRPGTTILFVRIIRLSLCQYKIK